MRPLLQLLLCGIIVPRSVLPDWLQWISNVLPASYALEALQQVGAYSEPTFIAVRDSLHDLVRTVHLTRGAIG